MQAVQTMPFCTDWLLCNCVLALHSEQLHDCTLWLEALLLLWPVSFLLDPWLSPLQWISQNPFKRNKNSQLVSEEGTICELKNWGRFLWDQTFAAWELHDTWLVIEKVLLFWINVVMQYRMAVQDILNISFNPSNSVLHTLEVRVQTGKWIPLATNKSIKQYWLWVAKYITLFW